MTERPPLGHLIVFEGVDGVGKTTIANEVANRLATRDVRVDVYAFPGKETHTLGALVYGLHHEAAKYDVRSMTPAALQAVHIAAHLDAIDRHLIPTLRKGLNLVMDRFWWSTWVYGRVAGVEETILDSLLVAERACWGDIVPTSTIVVTAPTPRGRMSEAELDGWQEKQDLYQQLADRECMTSAVDRIVNDRPLPSVIDEVLAVLRKRGLYDE